MKKIKNICNSIQVWVSMMVLTLLSKSTFAEDKLAGALTGDIAETFGSSGKFWTVFILIDIVLAAAMAIKTKNPMTFASVFFIVFIPGLLLKGFVF